MHIGSRILSKTTTPAALHLMTGEGPYLTTPQKNSPDWNIYHPAPGTKHMTQLLAEWKFSPTFNSGLVRASVKKLR